jgi:xanthine dehydrogenase large subunit
VDTSAALAMPGVRRDVLLARDIPGDPMLASFTGDEPIFAIDTVQHIGQVVGVVVADTVMQARRAARKVKLEHRSPAGHSERQGRAGGQKLCAAARVCHAR